MGKIKEFFKEHKEEIVTGAIWGATGMACVLLGYKAGVGNATFYTHAAVKKDPERFIKLANIGISKYSGKNLKRLEKAGEETVKAFEKFGV